jgi:hypothetical protein
MLVCNLRDADVTRVVGNADRRGLHSLSQTRARVDHFIKQRGRKKGMKNKGINQAGAHVSDAIYIFKINCVNTYQKNWMELVVALFFAK